MLVIYNDRCSKCMGLNSALTEAEMDWDALKYMEGTLSMDILNDIFDLYDGDYSDLVRTKEQAWKDSGKDIGTIQLNELKQFILENPIVLQRPIVIQDGKVVVARSPEKLAEILAS